MRGGRPRPIHLASPRFGRPPKGKPGRWPLASAHKTKAKKHTKKKRKREKERKEERGAPKGPHLPIKGSIIVFIA